jgi:hypothetical protein
VDKYSHFCWTVKYSLGHPGSGYTLDLNPDLDHLILDFDYLTACIFFLACTKPPCKMSDYSPVVQLVLMLMLWQDLCMHGTYLYAPTGQPSGGS